METKEILDAIRSLSGDFDEEIANLTAALVAEKDSRFRITNAGPMNPGKSTLFNAFLRKEEVFKTADARQTSVCQEEDWGDTFRLIDTPGCNSAVFEDNQESVAAFRKADLITFVHNINTGGLIKAEMEILKNLLAIFGKEDFTKRVCLVCNRIDDVQDDETIDRNVDEIKKQLKDNLKVQLTIFCVSPLNYLAGVSCEKKGKKEEAQIYYDCSKMNNLFNFVNDVWKKSGKRSLLDFHALQSKLEAARELQNNDLQTNRKSLSQIRSSAKAHWKQALENIRPAWDECL